MCHGDFLARVPAGQRFEREAAASKNALTQLRPLLEDIESEQARQALESSHIAIVGYYSDVMRLCAEQNGFLLAGD